jgi:hypothetical protein
MALSNLLRHKHLATARTLATHLGRVKLVFTLSSLGYCAVHWFIYHGFSVHMMSSALAFGAITATAKAYVSS